MRSQNAAQFLKNDTGFFLNYQKTTPIILQCLQQASSFEDENCWPVVKAAVELVSFFFLSKHASFSLLSFSSPFPLISFPLLYFSFLPLSFLFVCLCVCLFVCLSVCLSACLPVCTLISTTHCIHRAGRSPHSPTATRFHLVSTSSAYYTLIR